MSFKKYILAKFWVPAVLLNFSINYAVGYLLFRGEVEIFRWGGLGLCTDVIVNTVLISFFTYVGIAKKVGGHVASGEAKPLLQLQQRFWLALKWPAGNLVGALLFTFVFLLFVGGVWVAALLVCGPSTYSVSQAVMLKASYAGLLAALVVPPAVLLALRE